MGKGDDPLAGLDELREFGGFERPGTHGQDDSDEDDALEGGTTGRYRRVLARVLGREQSLLTPAYPVGTVVAFRPAQPSVPVTDPLSLTLGESVRIVSAKRADLVGKNAYALDPPNDQDPTAMLAMESGEIIFLTLVGDEPDATLERRHDGSVIVVVDGRQIESNIPRGVELAVGDTVRLSHLTYQIIGVLETADAIGEVVPVVRVVSTLQCEVDCNGTLRIVSTGKASVEEGDRVALDPSRSVILRNLGPTDDRFRLEGATGVTWDDIGGQDKAKALLRGSVIRPFKNPALWAHYRRKLPRGGLLYGPPGCGKTELGRALATEIADILRAKLGVENLPIGYLYVNAPDLLESLVGKAEERIRRLDDLGKRFYAKYGVPLVIFLDELDAVGKKRGTGISSDATDSIVTALNGVLDGVNAGGSFWLMATNRPDIIDPSLLREGRSSFKAEVGRPDQAAATTIFRIHLKKAPLHPDEKRPIEELAGLAAAELFDGKYAILELTGSIGEDSKTMPLTFGDLASGALIAGIVNRAAEIAFDRDDAAGAATGITYSDLVQSIGEKFEENAPLDHEDEVIEKVKRLGMTLTGVTTLRQVRG